MNTKCIEIQFYVAIGFNVETVSYRNLKFQVWDLGGQTSIRPYWRCYYSNTDAIFYVVDSQDRERIGISKQELVSMLEEEELKRSILVVLANKQVSFICLFYSLSLFYYQIFSYAVTRKIRAVVA